MYNHHPDNHTSFYTTLIILIILCSVELITSIISSILLLSPRLTEKRIRRILRIVCCCTIHDDEVLDSIVYWMAAQPSFKDLSLSDIVLGLLMTNMIYHDKKITIEGIDNPDERVAVTKMRVHEYIEYLNNKSMIFQFISLQYS